MELWLGWSTIIISLDTRNGGSSSSFRDRLEPTAGQKGQFRKKIRRDRVRMHERDTALRWEQCIDWAPGSLWESVGFVCTDTLRWDPLGLLMCSGSKDLVSRRTLVLREETFEYAFCPAVRLLWRLYGGSMFSSQIGSLEVEDSADWNHLGSSLRWPRLESFVVVDLKWLLVEIETLVKRSNSPLFSSINFCKLQIFPFQACAWFSFGVLVHPLPSAPFSKSRQPVPRAMLLYLALQRRQCKPSSLTLPRSPLPEVPPSLDSTPIPWPILTCCV